MQKPSAARMIKASSAFLAALLLAAGSYPASATEKSPTKTVKAASKDVSTKSETKEAPKDASKTSSKPKTKTAAEEAPQTTESASVAGAYEANGNLLSIVRYTQGKADEYLITYIPDTKKTKKYCPFFASLIIPSGATQFDAQRYAGPQLPVDQTDCKMRIKADGVKAEIVEMSKECQILCGEAQSIPNPGVLKRKEDE